MSEIILEDDDLAIICPDNCFAKGHLIVAPKQKFLIIEEVPSHLLEKMFQVTNKLSTVLFETLNCQGTNVLIQNGPSAGQITDQVSINIIPRYEEDELSLEWEPKQLDGSELEELAQKMNNTNKIVSKEPKESFSKPKEEIKRNESDEEVLKEDHYLVKALKRLP